MLQKTISILFLFSINILCSDCPFGYVEVENICYYKKHYDVLQDFVDNNSYLKNKQPQNIGYQEWTNNKLTYLYLGHNNIEIIPDSIGLLKDLLYLDLRSNKIKSIPESMCDLYPFYTELNLENNEICPTYPYCFEYLGKQNTIECQNFDCPLNYIKIEDECYYKAHLQSLQHLIDVNPSLEGLKPLELGNYIGYQEWTDGKLIHLNLAGNDLRSLPESFCSIYNHLESLDVSNNYICPPYPSCFEYIGVQNISHENCHNIDDIIILEEIIILNPHLNIDEPLLLGKQSWLNNRLVELSLDSLNITKIPESIIQLPFLEKLNLNNNKLNSLPNNFCDLYLQLKEFNIEKNYFCPPYLQCFDYVGQQNTEQCDKYLCSYGFSEINEECYSNQDIAILQEFIDLNPSLSGKKPIEIGVQKWKDMRLRFLYLGVNDLIALPNSICSIINNLQTLNVSSNNICPPYPNCIEQLVGEQNISNCQ